MRQADPALRSLPRRGHYVPATFLSDRNFVLSLEKVANNLYNICYRHLSYNKNFSNKSEYERYFYRIVLISGDSDFVPAAKLARREGIDFILDPLWQPISPSLYEHIDGLRSVIDRPQR